MPESEPVTLPAEGEIVAELEREHQEIDEGIATYLGAAGRGELVLGPLVDAVHALRRHIYLEEELLFPPIRAAGMVMPIMVMLREHAEIWGATDEVLAAVAVEPVDGARLGEVARHLLKVLAEHNAKEEPIVYPRTDRDLSDPERAELARAVRVAVLPDGWVCQALTA